MKKKTLLFLAVSMVLSTFLAACGGKEEAKPSETKKESKKEQVLNLISSSEPPALDSAKSTDSVSFDVLNNVMEGLYRLDSKDQPQPAIAESVEVSEDKKTYTFKLRDAKWSNGDAVTAKDFVFAWRRVVDPKTASEYAYIMYDIENAEEVNTKKKPVDQLGVKAIDDKTLEVKLKNAIPYFLGLTSFAVYFPQNEKVVTEKGDKYALEAENLVYNGPFVLSEWKHEASYKLTKNDSYWDKDAVKLKEINFNIVKETSAGVNLYNTKKVDRVGLTAEFVDKYKNDKNYGTFINPRMFFIRYNGKNPVFKNVNVRKAMSLAIDKESMVQVILNDGSVAADYLIPQKFVVGPDGKDFRETNGKLLSFNKDEAKKYWEQAKKELGKAQITVEMLNYDNDNAKKVGEYIKSQLETNLPGLTVKLKQQPFKQKLELERTQAYEFSFSGWGPDYQDPMTFSDMFVTDGPYNQMSYSNKEYDKLIADSKSVLLSDLPKRWEALLKSEKILLEQDAAITPIYQKGGAFLQREYVKGVVQHTFGADFSYKWASIE